MAPPPLTLRAKLSLLAALLALLEMRTIRLNPSQAEALRNADPAAYASYAAAYGQLVDEVAQVADRLGEKVDQFQRQGCVDQGPGT